MDTQNSLTWIYHLGLGNEATIVIQEEKEVAFVPRAGHTWPIFEQAAKTAR